MRRALGIDSRSLARRNPDIRAIMEQEDATARRNMEIREAMENSIFAPISADRTAVDIYRIFTNNPMDTNRRSVYRPLGSTIYANMFETYIDYGEYAGYILPAREEMYETTSDLERLFSSDFYGQESMLRDTLMVIREIMEVLTTLLSKKDLLSPRSIERAGRTLERYIALFTRLESKLPESVRNRFRRIVERAKLTLDTIDEEWRGF